MRQRLKAWQDRRRLQSTRQLMGIRRLTPHGLMTAAGEQVLFLLQPDNLTVLPPESIRERVTALANLLRAEGQVDILALDSRESFRPLREFYRERLSRENNPKLRELLVRDIVHLDEISASSASAREFVLVLSRGERAADEAALRQMEKRLRDHGLRVRLAEAEDVKRLLAVYYLRGMAMEDEEDIDGERAVKGYGEEKEEAAGKGAG